MPSLSEIREFSGGGFLFGTGDTVAGADFFDSLAAGNPAAGQPPSGSSFTATHLDLITLAPTRAVFGWYTFEDAAPASADSELLIRPADTGETFQRVAAATSAGGYHQLAAENLEPGCTYEFEARSDGMKVDYARAIDDLVEPELAQGRFTTPLPPPGEHVTTIAVINDTAIGLGETFTTSQFPTPWSYEVLEDQLAEIKALDVSVLLVNGDITSEARPHECAKAKELLDAYGTNFQDYFVVRGNHDRPTRVDEDPNAHYDRASTLDPTLAPDGRAYFDAIGDAFDLPYQRLWTHVADGVRIIGLDSSEAGNRGGGHFLASQLDELERIIDDDPHAPTITLSHHPLTDDQAATVIAHPAGRDFLVRQADADRLQEIQARCEGAFIHLGGHSHRSYRSTSPRAPRIDYLECGATGEQPNLYTLIDIYTGGYQVTSHRAVTDRILRRIDDNQRDLAGPSAQVEILQYEYWMGTSATRNYTVNRELGF